MRLELADLDILQPLIVATVREVLDQAQVERSRIDGKLAFDEATAAAMIGVNRHCLRDCRLRGELRGSKVGKKILYPVEELRRLLRENQT